MRIRERRGNSRWAARAVVVVLVTAGPVAAGEGARAQTGITVDDDVLVVDAAYPGTLTLTDQPGRPYGGPVLTCAYFSLVFGGLDVFDLVPVAPVRGSSYLWSCWEPGRHPYLEPFRPTYPVVVTYDPATAPPGEAITTPTAAAHALASIDFERPAIATAPSAVHVVGVPSWLAVTSRLDYPTASAEAGPVWATVRPVFRDVTWRFGNGDRVVCVGDATRVWHPGRDDDQTTDCAYAFETSGDGAFDGQATVTWTIWHRTDRHPNDWRVWGVVQLTTDVNFAVTGLEAAIN